jgi:hypothetical protein
MPRRRRSQGRSLSSRQQQQSSSKNKPTISDTPPAEVLATSLALPSWIFNSTQKDVLFFPSLVFFIMYTLTTLSLTVSVSISVLAALVYWIMSPPDRSIAKTFYDTPRVILLTG